MGAAVPIITGVLGLVGQFMGGGQDSAPEPPAPIPPPAPPPPPAPERGVTPDQITNEEASKDRARRRRLQEQKQSVNRLVNNQDSKKTLLGE